MLRLQKSPGWQSALPLHEVRQLPALQLKSAQAVSAPLHEPAPSHTSAVAVVALLQNGVPQLVVLPGKAQARWPLHEPAQAARLALPLLEVPASGSGAVPASSLGSFAAQSLSGSSPIATGAHK